jgi:hypothetical protein
MGTTQHTGCIVIRWTTDGYEIESSETRPQTVALLERLAALGNRSEAAINRAIELREQGSKSQCPALRNYYRFNAADAEAKFLKISEVLKINGV